MEKILVTGASGFLGSHMVEKLVQTGYGVRALVRNPTAFHQNLKLSQTINPSDIELVVGDLAEPNSLPAAVKGVDAVIHAAGLIRARNAQEYYRINEQGTRSLADALVRHNPSLKRYIYVSSLAAAGPGAGDQAQVSIEEARPISHYGKSKLMGEIALQSYQERLPITVVRPPLIYGPRDRGCLTLFRLVKLGIWPGILKSENRLSVVYVKDAAEMILRTLQEEKTIGRHLFLSDGRIYQIKDLVHPIQKAMQQKRIRTLPVPTQLAKWIARCADGYAKLVRKPSIFSQDKLKDLLQEDWSCNCQLTHDILQWRAYHDWEAGVAETLQWYQKAGWI